MKKKLEFKTPFSIETKSQEETFNFAAKFASYVEPGDFIALFGPMGGGKTAFVRGFASFFNLDSYVCSPTFTIINEYVGERTIVHCDFFRIDSEQSLFSTGFYEYLNSDATIVAEWCENISNFNFKFTASINFEILNLTTRKITVNIN